MPPQASATVIVPEEIKDLLSTLATINVMLHELFSAKRKDIVLTTATHKKFEVMFNKHKGCFELQLRNAGDLKAIAPFLPLTSWNKNKQDILWAYKRTIAIGSGGTFISASLFTTSAVNAVRTGATAWEAAVAGGAAAINAPLLGATLALTSLSAFSTYQANKHAASVNEALKLYVIASRCGDENESDTILHKARAILEQELGMGHDRVGGITRLLRNPSMSHEQIDFAAILLAEINMQLKQTAPYYDFEKVYNNSANKTIKAMCLISQIGMLHKKEHHRLASSTSNMTEQDITINLSGKVLKLNDNHVDVVDCYFEYVWEKYNEMFTIVQNAEFLNLSDAVKIANLEHRVSEVLGFVDLHMLRYMKPYGEIAEVMFTFAQSLCHVIMEYRYKSVFIDSQQKAESILAINKMQDWELLVNNLGVEIVGVVKVAQEYIDRYRQQARNAYASENAAKKELLNNNISLTFRSRKKNTPNEVTTMVNNAFRDSPDASDAAKNAKRLISNRYNKE